MESIHKTVEQAIQRRAWFIGKSLLHHWPKPTVLQCFVAGGSLTGVINDIDLFPSGELAIPDPANAKLLSHTKNASTFECRPWLVQVCAHRKPSLEALVRSFDYTHIQAGARLTIENDLAFVGEVFFTDEYVAARATETTWFCGSEFPLSSLIRVGKYYKRSAMPRGAFIRAVIDALAATVKRGFKDYEDFKDQLDAVDLGLLKDEMDEVEKAKLLELFELLKRPG
jgi:hypothetical protein